MVAVFNCFVLNLLFKCGEEALDFLEYSGGIGLYNDILSLKLTVSTRSLSLTYSLCRSPLCVK